MSEHKQETRADIVVEMRDLGKLDEKSTDMIPRSLMGLGLRTYADRLEAAHEREKATAEKSSAVGNKAMRDALTKLVTYLDKEVKRTSKCERCKYKGKSFRGEPCYWHVDCGIFAYDVEASDNAKFILKKFKLKSALTAPLRNCDRFKTKEQAEVEFMMSDELPRDNGDIEMRAWMCRFIDWLFAPATEQEGDKDGSKQQGDARCAV